MIPSLEHQEWRDLLLGKMNPQLNSHLLKIKLNSLKQRLKRKSINLEDAVRELYFDCSRHEDIYQKDLHRIFHHIPDKIH